MTIELFADRNCRGASRIIDEDLSDLKDMDIDKPSSLRLTSEDEAILLYRNDDWHGGVHYVRGPANVTDLGRSKTGGRFQFRNSIRSVRVTPFTLKLDISVITDEEGNLPGSWTSEGEADAEIGTIIGEVNNWYENERVLLHLSVERVNFRSSDRHFNMPRRRDIPASWRNKGEIEVLFINQFSHEGVFGNSRKPCWGERNAIAKLVDIEGEIEEPGIDFMPITVAHELGHYMGLEHDYDDGVSNIMFPGGHIDTHTLRTRFIRVDQIREMHKKLSKNISRRADRHD